MNYIVALLPAGLVTLFAAIQKIEITVKIKASRQGHTPVLGRGAVWHGWNVLREVTQMGLNDANEPDERTLAVLVDTRLAEAACILSAITPRLRRVSYR
jgi:hypothetical protein